MLVRYRLQMGEPVKLWLIRWSELLSGFACYVMSDYSCVSLYGIYTALAETVVTMAWRPVVVPHLVTIGELLPWNVIH